MVPLEAEHFARMTVQPAQAHMYMLTGVDALRHLEGPFSATLMEDGCPLACAGAVMYWENRALVWSFLSDKVNISNFWQIHCAAKAFLAGLPQRRLEASVDVNFAAGHRWARSLGFEVEAPLQRAFHPDGTDCVGYVLVRER